MSEFFAEMFADFFWGGRGVPVRCQVRGGVPVQCQVQWGVGVPIWCQVQWGVTCPGCPVQFPGDPPPLLTDKLKTLPPLTLRVWAVIMNFVIIGLVYFQ